MGKKLRTQCKINRCFLPDPILAWNLGLYSSAAEQPGVIFLRPVAAVPSGHGSGRFDSGARNQSYWRARAIDPAIIQLGAAGVLAVMVGLFVSGKIGPMSLVDRADARADKAIAAVSQIARDVTDLTIAVKELTATIRANEQR